MASPIDLSKFQELTIMPPEAVQELEGRRNGFIAKRLDRRWNLIQAILRKRYDVAAMQVDPPETAIGWLVDLVTKDAYGARGYDPQGKSDEDAVIKAFDLALEQLQIAADSEKGYLELPLLASRTDGGVSKGGPFGYSEQSPYRSMDLQRDAARAEDESG